MSTDCGARITRRRLARAIQPLKGLRQSADADDEQGLTMTVDVGGEEEG